MNQLSFNRHASFLILLLLILSLSPALASNLSSSNEAPPIFAHNVNHAPTSEAAVQTVVPAAPHNLVLNGGFDQGAKHWTSYQGASSVSLGKLSSSHFAWVQQDLDIAHITAHKRYRLQATVRALDKCAIGLLAGTPTSISFQKALDFRELSLKQKYFDVTMPAHTSWAAVYVESGAQGCQVSDISFFEINASHQTEHQAAAAKDPNICLGNASYTISYINHWTSTSHPHGFPMNASYSGFVGATHNAYARLFQVGASASAGLKQLAELGQKDALKAEAQAALHAGVIDHVLSEKGVSQAIYGAQTSFDITFHATHSKLSLVSMIAPSPDWFVALDGLELCRHGQWIAEALVNAYAYDAGTDAGLSYLSPNAPQSPAAVSQLKAAPFLVNDQILPVGQFKIVRKTH